MLDAALCVVAKRKLLHPLSCSEHPPPFLTLESVGFPPPVRLAALQVCVEGGVGPQGLVFASGGKVSWKGARPD